MIFGQTMTIIIITIIKHHNSKHYIYSIFIKTDDNRLCLFKKKYRFIISRMLTKHFRSELFDDSGIVIFHLLRFKFYIYSCSRHFCKFLDSPIIFGSISFTIFTCAILKIMVDNIGVCAIAFCFSIYKACMIIQEHFNASRSQEEQFHGLLPKFLFFHCRKDDLIRGDAIALKFLSEMFEV